jgi:hypothetical protein
MPSSDLKVAPTGQTVEAVLGEVPLPRLGGVHVIGCRVIGGYRVDLCNRMLDVQLEDIDPRQLVGAVGDVVLLFACVDTLPAAYACPDVDDHAILCLIFRGFSG